MSHASWPGTEVLEGDGYCDCYTHVSEICGQRGDSSKVTRVVRAPGPLFVPPATVPGTSSSLKAD